VARVRKLSNSNGFAFHLEWPFTIARDLTLRMQGSHGHLRRLDWLYGFDAAPEPVLPPPDRTQSAGP
jgi:salicylate hydroxylase